MECLKVQGPLLSLIYINDIVNSSKLAHFVLFADDTNIFVSGANKNEAYINANKVLSDIHNYMLKKTCSILTWASLCTFILDQTLILMND